MAYRETGTTPAATAALVHNWLMNDDLNQANVDEYAERLGLSSGSLRRQLRQSGMAWQGLLDQARQTRCQNILNSRWVPGKEMAWLLGYREMNSFYRRFRTWFGKSYIEFKHSRRQADAPI